MQFTQFAPHLAILEELEFYSKTFTSVEIEAHIYICIYRERFFFARMWMQHDASAGPKNRNRSLMSN